MTEEKTPSTQADRWPRYHLYRAVINRPTSRFGRWTIEFIHDGDGTIPMVLRSDIGLPGSWTQAGAERKARRHLRRLRRQHGSYLLWELDEDTIGKGSS